MHPWSTNISTQTRDVHRIGFESTGALELDNEYSGLAGVSAHLYCFRRAPARMSLTSKVSRWEAAHAATIKQQYKRVWLGGRPGLVKNDFYDLYMDPREMRGMMAQFLWAWGPFDMMKKRHDNLNAEYPFTPTRHGIPFEGIENLRAESIIYQNTVKRSLGLEN